MGPKGLSILAVTEEGVSDTEKWIEEKGAKYGYAYDKGGKLKRYFGVQGIPHAVLVDPSGAVIWRGNPGTLTEPTLTGALRGALPKPVWEWPDSAKGVKSALLKRSFKSALDQASKVGAGNGGTEIVAALQGMVRAQIDALRASFDKGDFLGAQSAAQTLQKELTGLPEVDNATEVLSAIAASKDAQVVIKGQEKVAKIRAAENAKRKDIQQSIESLKKLKKDYPDTYVTTESDQLIELLSERLRKE